MEAARRRQHGASRLALVEHRLGDTGLQKIDLILFNTSTTFLGVARLLGSQERTFV
jgi:hypothetical protein